MFQSYLSNLKLCFHCAQADFHVADILLGENMMREQEEAFAAAQADHMARLDDREVERAVFEFGELISSYYYYQSFFFLFCWK